MTAGPGLRGRGAGSQTIAAVERAADVLAAFTDHASLGVTELATRLALSKAVVHRTLASLRTRGFVDLEESTRRYTLGPAALALGLSYLQRIDVRDPARAVLRGLSDATGETATLSVRRGHVRMYIEQVTPAREVHMTVRLGLPYPLHAGASSKCFLAFLSDDARAEYLAGHLASLTPRTVTDPAPLGRQLDAIRRRGYAVSFGERQEGAGSVAAPILDHEQLPVAVVSVCGPADRFRREVERIAPLLLEATAGLSRRFGARI